MGLVFVPLATSRWSASASTTPAWPARVVNTTQQVGGSLGTALLNTIFTTRRRRLPHHARRVAARPGGGGDPRLQRGLHRQCRAPRRGRAAGDPVHPPHSGGREQHVGSGAGAGPRALSTDSIRTRVPAAHSPATRGAWGGSAAGAASGSPGPAGSGGRCGGLADDQVGRDQQVVGRDLGRRRGSRRSRGSARRPRPAPCQDVLADRGQRRPHPRGRGAVVEPDHREVLGDPQPQVVAAWTTPCAMASEKHSTADGRGPTRGGGGRRRSRPRGGRARARTTGGCAGRGQARRASP